MLILKASWKKLISKFEVLTQRFYNTFVGGGGGRLWGSCYSITSRIQE